MNIKSLTMSLLLLASALFADQQPIDQALTQQLGIFGSSIETSVLDDHLVMIYTPITVYPLLGGSTRSVSKAYGVQSVLERTCLAYGGDVYFDQKDKFGDTVSKHSFNQEILGKMSPQEKMQYIEMNKDGNALTYKISWSDLTKKLFTEERIIPSFLVDKDMLRKDNFLYNTVCKDPATNQIIYTAKNKMQNATYLPAFLIINFTNKISKQELKHSQTTKTLEEVYAGNIEDQKGNKILLKSNAMTLLTSNYAQSAKEYCDLVGGTTMVNTRAARAGEHLVTQSYEQIACINTQHPFTLKYFSGNYLISKDTTPVEFADSQNNSNIDDAIKDYALSASTMPLGSPFINKKEIAGHMFHATVYANTGEGVLVNVQEKNNPKSIKNYQIKNGVASDITEPNLTQESVSQIPQKILDDKRALEVACSVNGSSVLNVDGYTASCIRNRVGYDCSTIMVYTKGNQFAGKEIMGCLRQ